MLLWGNVKLVIRLGLWVGVIWVISIDGSGVVRLGLIMLSRCWVSCGNFVFCLSCMCVVRKVVFLSRCLM